MCVFVLHTLYKARRRVRELFLPCVRDFAPSQVVFEVWWRLKSRLLITWPGAVQRIQQPSLLQSNPRKLSKRHYHTPHEPSTCHCWQIPLCSESKYSWHHQGWQKALMRDEIVQWYYEAVITLGGDGAEIVPWVTAKTRCKNRNDTFQVTAARPKHEAVLGDAIMFGCNEVGREVESCQTED